MKVAPLSDPKKNSVIGAFMKGFRRDEGDVVNQSFNHSQ
jgi:hypothetical protein